MSGERRKCSSFAGPDLGQAANLAGPMWATCWVRSGTTLCKSLNFFICFQTGPPGKPKTTLNALVLLGETALQLQLRMVCALRSPARAKQTKVRPLPFKGRAFASHLGWVFGIAAASISNLTSPVEAESWKKASATAGWSSADRFRTKTPLKTTRTPSLSFNSFLASLKGGDGPFAMLSHILAVVSSGLKRVHDLKSECLKRRGVSCRYRSHVVCDGNGGDLTVGHANCAPGHSAICHALTVIMRSLCVERQNPSSELVFDDVHCHISKHGDAFAFGKRKNTIHQLGGCDGGQVEICRFLLVKPFQNMRGSGPVSGVRRSRSYR